MLDLAFFTDEVARDDFDASVRQGVEAGANATELRGGLYGKKIQDISDEDAERIRHRVPVREVRSHEPGGGGGASPHLRADGGPGAPLWNPDHPGVRLLGPGAQGRERAQTQNRGLPR